LVAGNVSGPIAEPALAAVGLLGSEIGPWLAALNSTDELKPFQDAEQQARIDEGRCHLQVMARAALLLAIATVSARQQLVKAGYTMDHLKFWWQRYGMTRGLWDTTTQPDNPLDLWADVREALAELQAWQMAQGGGASLRAWRKAQSHIVELLGAFELVAVWGLAA
jgi:hypothetical protein